MWRIRFRGEEYVCYGPAGGPIMTLDDYRHGRPSFAHLMEDGSIKRHGRVIGTRGDIEWLEEIPVPLPAGDAWANLFGA